MGENKFEKNKQYYTISIYTVCTVLVCALFIKALINITECVQIMKSILSVLSPFIIGFFLAYIINPLVKTINKRFFQQLLHCKPTKFNKTISIVIAYILVFGIVITCIMYIIPQIIDSLMNLNTLIKSAQTGYDKIMKYINDINLKHPDLDFTFLTNLTNNIMEQATAFISEFIPKLASKIAPTVINTSISIISWVINILMAIIISVYMIIDKNRLKYNVKRLFCVALPKKKTSYFFSTLRKCDNIFSGFIIGKTVDSVIIGFLCFFLTSLFKIPYTVLISVIVGITNMIPYFGPFIGAIPSVLILLLVNPKSAIVFTIIIFALQQFDGLFLGPHILGESTGLRPLWIIFAITIGGSIAGPIGMFLGVPSLAVIAFLTDEYLTYKLNKKEVIVPFYSDDDISDSKSKNNANNE